MIIRLKNKDKLTVGDFIFKCSIGNNGISKSKIEGDKKTPIGIFDLGNLYYRKDRIKYLQTNLKKVPIKKKFGWCDDVKCKDYNRIIDIKKRFHHEKLFRRDHKYDLFIPIKYNFNKIIPGKGSAIFIHLTNNYKPTAGCIALSKNDFLIMLKLINKNTKILIN